MGQNTEIKILKILMYANSACAILNMYFIFLNLSLGQNGMALFAAIILLLNINAVLKAKEALQ